MKLTVDSREKKNSHILAWFDKHGIEYEVKKLDVGDYMIDGGTNILDLFVKPCYNEQRKVAI